MPRVIRKGAITFGQVHVPVTVQPAAQDVGVDFDWLDKRSMDPVGRKSVDKRVDKRSVEEIQPAGIVQGQRDFCSRCWTCPTTWRPWAGEIRDVADLNLPPEGKAAARLQPARRPPSSCSTNPGR